MHNKRQSAGLIAITVAIVFLAVVNAGDSTGEILSNSEIIALTRANVSQELILSKINTSRNTFDTSARAMITLKENGVTERVISAMMTAGATIGRATVDPNHLRTELRRVSSDGAEAKNGGMAWMLANREQALPAVRQALGDSEPDIRSASLQVLAWFKDQQSLPAIRNLLTDPSPSVRQATAQTLVALDDPQVRNAAELALNRQVNPLDGYIRVFGYARLAYSAGLLGQVLANNPNPLNRSAAAWALGEIGRAGVEGRPALENALLNDSVPDVRREAVLAMAKFHDGESARLLQEACRRDPEVRKATLAAMADYPEAVGFLVWVMNLGGDVISADELETARASLSRLTGQDFRLDGVRWEEWYAANHSRFPGSTVMSASMQSQTAQISQPIQTGSGIPTGPLTLTIPVSAPAAPQVDVEKWGLVADSAGIPMAPQAEFSSPAPLGQNFSPAPQWESYAGQTSNLPIPTSLSPDDFGSASTQFSPIDTGIGYGTNAGSVPLPASVNADGSGGASTFKTWTSDPSRGAPQTPVREARTIDDVARGSFGSFSSDLQGMEANEVLEEAVPGPDFSSSDGIGQTETTWSPATSGFESSTLPKSRIISPMTDSSSAESGADSLRGISLPLPPLNSEGTSSFSNSGTDFDTPDFSSPYGIPQDAANLAAPPSAASLTPMASDPLSGAEAMSFGNVFESADLPVSDNPNWDESLVTEMGTANEYIPPVFEGAPGAEFEEAGEITVYRSEPTPFNVGSSPDPSSGFPSLPMPSSDSAQVVPDALRHDDSSSGGSVIFVEPQPGQVVIGEALAAPGVDSVGAQQDYGGYSGYDETAPYDEATTSTPGGLNGTAMEMPALPAAQPQTYQEPATDAYAASPSPTGKVYPEVQQMYQPPVPFSGGDPFTDPSAPMPPVKIEATITAPQGKEMPPTLGEDIFRK